MNAQAMIWRQLQSVLEEMKQLVRLLAVVEDSRVRNLAAQQLVSNIGQVQFLTNLQMQAVAAVAPTATTAPTGLMAATPPVPAIAGPHMPMATTRPLAPGPTPAAPPAELPIFTREQLATFTGRNGEPAYVAVNGTVYDVTNNAAWSAATHFGLPAGRDLTADFASCHAGQQWILRTLRPVGRLAS